MNYIAINLGAPITENPYSASYNLCAFYEANKRVVAHTIQEKNPSLSQEEMESEAQSMIAFAFWKAAKQVLRREKILDVVYNISPVLIVGATIAASIIKHMNIPETLASIIIDAASIWMMPNIIARGTNRLQKVNPAYEQVGHLFDGETLAPDAPGHRDIYRKAGRILRSNLKRLPASTFG